MFHASRRLYIVWLAVLASFLFVASHSSAVQSRSQEDEIRATIETWARAWDRRDVDALRSILLSDSRHFFKTPDDPSGLTVVSGSQFLAMLEAGRIGGAERSLVIEVIHNTRDLMASAIIRREHPDRLFLVHLSLANVNGEWKIVSEMTMATEP